MDKLENIKIETTRQKTERKRDEKNEKWISALWNNFKEPNLCITRIQEEEKKRIEIEKHILDEIIAKNFRSW